MLCSRLRGQRISKQTNFSPTGGSMLKGKITEYEPTDFGDRKFSSALVLVTNVCNLECKHCFVFRDDTPNSIRDKMNDVTMLHQLEVLRDKHDIRSMLFMGGEPMIRKELVLAAMDLFENSSIVTNATYGIPSVPGHLVTVSLDGPEEVNDPIRGEGVFQQVKEAVYARDPHDGTIVMLQMVVTRENENAVEDFVKEVQDWPVDGIAFTFYVPDKGEKGGMAWDTLEERNGAVRKVMDLKRHYPKITSNLGTLELMLSENAMASTGAEGENCGMRNMLPLYMGSGGQFEKPFCCYGNNVDCSRCGAYGVFNSAYHKLQRKEETRHLSGI